MNIDFSKNPRNLADFYRLGHESVDTSFGRCLSHQKQKESILASAVLNEGRAYMLTAINANVCSWS